MARKTATQMEEILPEEMEALAPGSVLDRQDNEFFSAGAGAVIDEEVDAGSIEAMAARDGLLGSMVKTATEIIQAMPSHWGIMSEKERANLLQNVRDRFSPLVHEAVRMVASKGRRIVTGTIDRMTTKETIQVVITAPRSPEACAAFGMSAGGGQVAFLLLDTESLLTDRARISISDQLEMELDEESDETEPSMAEETETCPL